MIKYLLPKKVEPDPVAFGHICKVFHLAGGSWKDLFDGSVEDVQLLRRIIKVAVKIGVLRRAPKWT